MQLARENYHKNNFLLLTSMQNNIFYTILLRFLAIIFHRQTIIARVFLLLCLNWYNEHTFVVILQFILVPELYAYAATLFVKTLKQFMIELQSLIFNVYGVVQVFETKQLPPLPPHTPPLIAVEYEILEKVLPIITIGEESDGSVMQLAQANNKLPIADFPAQLELLKNGNWLINGEEKTLEQIKKIHSKYKSEHKSGKATPRSMQFYIFWTNTLQEIDRQLLAVKKQKDTQYSQDIEKQINS